MPYIAFDLDALNAAPYMARAAGITEDSGIAGLLRLWAHCFRTEADQVSAVMLAGIFGTDNQRLPAALVDFEFLEARGDGWRVRGADRYLRLKEARRRGGQAAKQHLRRGGGQPGVNSGSSRAPAGLQPEVQPGTSSGSAPALTPSTEHRAPNEKNSLYAREAQIEATQVPASVTQRETEPPFKSPPAHAGEPPRPTPSPTPENAPAGQPGPSGDLLEDLIRVYAEVRGSPRPMWGMREARDLMPLIRHPPAEVIRRARIAFDPHRQGFPRVATPLELAQRWDHFDRPPEPRTSGRRPPPPKEDPNRPLGEVPNEF